MRTQNFFANPANQVPGVDSESTAAAISYLSMSASASSGDHAGRSRPPALVTPLPASQSR